MDLKPFDSLNKPQDGQHEHPNEETARSSRAIEAVGAIRSKFPQLVERIGRAATIVTASIALLTFIFGQKYPLQAFSAEHLYRVILPRQQITSSETGAILCINTCIITNDGKTNAKEVSVLVNVRPSVPFSDYNISGAEGSWEVNGGKASDYIRVRLPRLVATHSLRITVMTASPADISCDAASESSRAVETPRLSVMSLHIGDFIVLALTQLMVALLVQQQSRKK